MNNPNIKKSSKLSKEFNYAAGKASFQMSVNIEEKQEILDLKICLEEAVDDLKRELLNHK